MSICTSCTGSSSSVVEALQYVLLNSLNKGKADDRAELTRYDNKVSGNKSQQRSGSFQMLKAVRGSSKLWKRSIPTTSSLSRRSSGKQLWPPFLVRLLLLQVYNGRLNQLGRLCPLLGLGSSNSRSNSNSCNSCRRKLRCKLCKVHLRTNRLHSRPLVVIRV